MHKIPIWYIWLLVPISQLNENFSYQSVFGTSGVYEALNVGETQSENRLCIEPPSGCICLAETSVLKIIIK